MASKVESRPHFPSGCGVIPNCNPSFASEASSCSRLLYQRTVYIYNFCHSHSSCFLILLANHTDSADRMSKPTLISATPSPYARKVRITLQEKAIPFTLQTEVPWDSTTATPSYNPLEKLPVLILDNAEKTSVYESSYILEYIEYKMKGNGWKAMSDDVDERLLEKKVDVTCTAVMDALVLVFFERQREQKSVEWEARQLRKVKGGLGQVAEVSLCSFLVELFGGSLPFI